MFNTEIRYLEGAFENTFKLKLSQLRIITVRLVYTFGE